MSNKYFNIYDEKFKLKNINIKLSKILQYFYLYNIFKKYILSKFKNYKFH